MNTTGKLYIVATPIGNLEDISLRALRILKEVDLIAAEDTRVTAKLLSHFEIKTSVTSYHQYTRETKSEWILEKLQNGSTVALVTDAGTPGISDPGHELILSVIERGIPLESVPGPCAAISALVGSGLSTDRFCFEGFPPRTRKERMEFFQSLARDQRTLIFHESPYRLCAILKVLQEVMGDRQIAVARELTKIHEEFFRGKVSEAVEYFQRTAPRGEIVLVVEGASSEADQNQINPLEMFSVEEHLGKLIREGLTEKEAIRKVAQIRKIPRREVYAKVLQMKGKC